MRVQKARIDRV